MLWAENISSHILPGWALNVAYLAHTYESLLAVAHITLVHIPGVIGRPGVSALSCMILNGKISPSALAEEHGDDIYGDLGEAAKLYQQAYLASEKREPKCF